MQDLTEILKRLAYLSRDFPAFLRTPVTASEAARQIERRLATRGERFLGLAQRAIYGYPASPYRQLLKAAGCEPGDLRTLLSGEGLEGTLRRLAEAGVYLTFEEFKGRREVVRGSARLSFQQENLDNPFAIPHFEAQSGGTRGPGTSVKMAFPYFADLAVNTAVAFEEHGLSDYDHAIWLQGFTPGLIYAKLGRPPIGWLLPVSPLPTRQQLGYAYMVLLGRLVGRPLVEPTMLDLREPERLVSWLLDRRREGRSVCVTTYASSAVRTCTAARDRGVSLEGVCFVTMGEPFTEAKRRAVDAVGARVLVRYAFTEAGIIGYGCGTPQGSDDLHFLHDSYGLIQRSRTVGEDGPTVEALLYTSLLRWAPKILLNVESGDSAVLEQRACGCRMGELGLNQHISQIRSFEKLSGEGMTFARSSLLRVLEEVLPARFGGASTDYQVIEEEGERGVLRLVLIVSPTVGTVDEAALRQTFLDELGRDGRLAQYMATVWQRAGTVVVRRQPPMATRAGKILPFHLARVSSGSG
jgi:hypothetical protein